MFPQHPARLGPTPASASKPGSTSRTKHASSLTIGFLPNTPSQPSDAFWGDCLPAGAGARTLLPRHESPTDTNHATSPAIGFVPYTPFYHSWPVARRAMLN
jgi:hypothetical protein